MDLLSNADVKSKLGEIFNDGFAKLSETLMKKVDEMNTTILALKLELSAKDAVIDKVQKDNQLLHDSVKNLSAVNENLQQEAKRDNLLFTGFAPSFAEALASQSGDGNDTSTVHQSSVIGKVVEFCRHALQIPSFSTHDVSSAHFLSPSKPSPGRPSTGSMLLVRFTRRAMRDEVLSKKRLLKNYNQENHTKHFINEDLILSRRKLFGEARKAHKDGKLDGAWTSAGSVRVKLSTGRKVTVNSVAELNHLFN